MTPPAAPACAPHPGPRPDAFTFPFEAAAAARLAITDLVADLHHLIAAHEAAAIHVRPGFEGLSRQAFEQKLAALLDELRQRITGLQAQLDVIEARTALAHRRLEASHEALLRWDRQLREHRAGRATPQPD